MGTMLPPASLLEYPMTTGESFGLAFPVTTWVDVPCTYLTQFVIQPPGGAGPQSLEGVTVGLEVAATAVPAARMDTTRKPASTDLRVRSLLPARRMCILSPP